MQKGPFSQLRAMLKLTLLGGSLAAFAHSLLIAEEAANTEQAPATTTSLPALSHLQLAQLMLACARDWEQTEAHENAEVIAQLRALARQWEPNAQADGEGVAALDLAKRLMAAARQSLKEGRVAHVPMMLDVIVSLTPQNRDLVYQTALLRQEIPWQKRWPELAKLAPADPATTASSGAEQSTTKEETPTQVLQREQAEIHGLVVTQSDKNVLGGYVGEVIATRQERDSTKAPTRVHVNGKVDKTMRISLDEALRLALLRLPDEVSNGQRVVMSFDDKYGSKAGPSAGTAFTLALLSVLGSLEIDPQAAFTGDITVDGEVRPVGGVGHKITGAQKGGMKLVAVPTKNASSVEALALMEGPGILAKIQIFAVSTIDQAQEIADVNREGKTAEAIQRFAALQPRLQQGNALKTNEVKEELQAITELASHHLSAKYLLQASQGQLAGRMSVYDSVDHIMERISPILSAFYSSEASAQRTGYGGYIFVQKRNYAFSLEELDRISKELQELDGRVSPKAEAFLAAAKRLLMRVRSFQRRYRQIPHFSGYGGYIQRFNVDQVRVQALRSVGLQFKDFTETLRTLRNDREYIEATKS